MTLCVPPLAQIPDCCKNSQGVLTASVILLNYFGALEFRVAASVAIPGKRQS